MQPTPRVRVSEVDVVVVGAGAAGIAAARELACQGVSHKLIEARGRAGGRCHTRRLTGGALFDVGASWLHAADQGNPFVEVAWSLGIRVRNDSLRRHFVGAPVSGAGAGDGAGGTPTASRRAASSTSQRALDEYQRVRDRAFAEIARLAAIRADASVADALSGQGTFERMVAMMAGNWFCGDEAGAIDARDWASGRSGEDWVARDGFGALLSALARGLDIAFGQTVRAIRVAPGGVEIETGGGTMRAAHVILTVPLGVLAQRRIAIEPALPEHVQRAIAALPMGLLSKVALVFDGDPFELGQDLFLGVLPVESHGFLYLLRPWDQPMLYAFVGGDRARALEGLGEEAIIEAALAPLVAQFGRDVERRLRGRAASMWSRDELAFGSYTNALPGHFAARESLSAPIHERLHLAGEANAPDGWHCTVAGAHLAGRRAARQVTRALRA